MPPRPARGQIRAMKSRSSTSAAAFRALQSTCETVLARWPGKISVEIDRLFPKDIESWPSRGGSRATAARRLSRSSEDRSRWEALLYIDDSVYHTFSGIIFDHCQYHLSAFRKGKPEICAVFGQPAMRWTPFRYPENCRN